MKKKKAETKRKKYELNFIYNMCGHGSNIPVCLTLVFAEKMHYLNRNAEIGHSYIPSKL